MTNPDIETAREFIGNAHRVPYGAWPECPALDQGVLDSPSACDCGVKEALSALDRLTTRLAAAEKVVEYLAGFDDQIPEEWSDDGAVEIELSIGWVRTAVAALTQEEAPSE